MSPAAPAESAESRAGILNPASILELNAEEADGLLDRLERTVPVAPNLAHLPGLPATQAHVIGDSHGDWRSTQEAVQPFLADPMTHVFVGLGDYVDRAPDDCGEGSVANALYLLQLAGRFPSRVVLVKGNHELHREFPVLPHDLPEEVDQLWGPEVERYARILGLLERGPFAAVAESGAYFAHAGFPMGVGPPVGLARFDALDVDDRLNLVWADCAAGRSRRGVARTFTERDLTEFLNGFGGSVFLRGHDPDLVGRPVLGDHCLTLHTSRRYERFGGVLRATVPLQGTIGGASRLRLEHLATEGRHYPAV
ncbi:MAG TPA: metallophosphoesterase [Thermoplasmata archaeon]|nr:metallophosphoesterase [Thermoplasmata archaeon]